MRTSGPNQFKRLLLKRIDSPKVSKRVVRAGAHHPPQEQAIDKNAEHESGGDYDKETKQRVEADEHSSRTEENERKVRAEKDELAMREIHHIHDAPDERQAKGGEPIDSPDEEPVGDGLGEKEIHGADARAPCRARPLSVP
jgi:hypothetical protein